MPAKLKPDTTHTFPSPSHDHGHCAKSALKKAEELCRATGKKFTDIRKQVLKEVWGSHTPIGAYDILAAINENGGRTAPMAVYRALEFLMENGLVHRIASLNAYIGCAHPDREHAAGFLICRECGCAAELDGAILKKALGKELRAQGFTIDSQVVELSGTCPHCQDGRKRA